MYFKQVEIFNPHCKIIRTDMPIMLYTDSKDYIMSQCALADIENVFSTYYIHIYGWDVELAKYVLGNEVARRVRTLLKAS